MGRHVACVRMSPDRPIDGRLAPRGTNAANYERNAESGRALRPRLAMALRCGRNDSNAPLPARFCPDLLRRMINAFRILQLKCFRKKLKVRAPRMRLLTCSFKQVDNH